SLAGIVEADASRNGVVENSQTPNGPGLASAPGTLTLAGSGTYSYNGYVRNVDSQPLALIKSGIGTQTLVGDRVTYTGVTTLSGGTLALQDTTGFASATGVGASGTLNAARTVAGFASRSALMGNAVTGSGIININGAANTAGTTSGGWTIISGATNSLNFSG